MRFPWWALGALAISACQPLIAPGSIVATGGDTSVHVSSSTNVDNLHLLLSDYPTVVTAGTALSLTVAVVDNQNQPVNYSGVLHVSSSDAQSALPADTAITSGRMTLRGIVLKTAAAQSISVSDAQAPTLTSVLPAAIRVQSGNTAALRLGGLASVVQAGQAGPLTVLAVDAYGNATPNYSATVQFSSSDTLATVPANVTLQNGAAISINGALFTAGVQQWMAQDATHATVMGQQNIVVSPATAGLLASTLVASPTGVPADNRTPSTLTATLRDAFGNAVPGMSVSFSGAGVNLAPATATTNMAGQATAGVRCDAPGSVSISAVFGGSQALSTQVGFSTTCADVGFSAASPLSNGSSMSRSQSVAMGDINGDGKPDVAVANYGSNNVTLFINQGNGSFAVAAGGSLAAGSGANAVLLLDINLDGKLDLVTANWLADTLSVFYGDGRGNFATPVTYGTGNEPVAMVAADLNGDGRPDLAVANQRDNSVTLLRNNSSGFTAWPAYDQGMQSNGIAAGDVDNDGHVDLVTASYTGNKVNVLRNAGNGQTYTHSTYAVGAAYWVALADFNGDGKLDMVVPSYDMPNNQDSNQISVLLNIGGGTYAAAVPYTVGTRPLAVTVADFDIDGIADIVVTNNATSNVSLLPGVGDGSFKVQRTLATNDNPYGLAAGDFSGDGRPDLLVTSDNVGNGSLSVFINNCN